MRRVRPGNTHQVSWLSSLQILNEFLERDSWWDSISSFVADKRETTTSNVLQYAIDMPLDRINNDGHQRRVGRVMRSLGWELKSTSREVNGKRKSVRLWVNPDKTTVAGPSDSEVLSADTSLYVCLPRQETWLRTGSVLQGC